MTEHKPIAEPTQPTDAAEPTDVVSDGSKRRLSSGDRWAIAGSSTLGLLFIAGMIGGTLHQSSEAKAHQRLDDQLNVEVVDDGFKGLAEGTQDTGVGGQVYGVLHVDDHCSLHGVRLAYGEKDGHVTDVTGYTVSLVLDGVKDIEVRGKRHDTVLEGTVVERHFTDMTDFTANLGNLTCNAMDENLQLQNSVDRVNPR